jgi:hypothetical protein
MAITQDYVSAAGTEGNDYKGASFADGAYAKATKTLTKAGAFTASKVNHYIYITGTHITSGYYKISDVTGAPNAVVLATDASSDGNDSTDVHCTQADGSTTLPWRSLQGAFDLCTRNATDGNQVNLKAGTAQVNAAALDLTTFIAGGALGASAPLIVRGYTAAANDGGIGEIDCNGVTMFADATVDSITLADLEIHTFGNNNGIALDDYITLFRCEVHKGASAPNTKSLISVDDYAAVIGCYVHDLGVSGIGISIASGPGCHIADNYIVLGADGATGIVMGGNSLGTIVRGNVVTAASAGATGINASAPGTFTSVVGNTFYNSAAGTARGIYCGLASIVLNNVVEGWSGVGGDGIEVANVYMIGYNAFYNCLAPVTVTGQKFIDLTANDVALAASPFTSPATGDFSLTTAAKTALRGVGWPAAYLGAHASTDGHITIGAVQYGEAEAGGAGVYRRVARILGG